MLKKIKKLFKKKVEKKKPIIDSRYSLDDIFDPLGFLVMQDNENLRDFVFYCDVAYKTQTFFDRVIIPTTTYKNIHTELIRQKTLTARDGSKNVEPDPFTIDGDQVLYGLTDPFAKRDVKVYTIKPKEFLVVN